MKKFAKIPAGALQFVVFTSVVIAILLAAFVSLTHVHGFFKKQSYDLVNTIKNTDEGIRHALAKDLALNDSTRVTISGEDRHAVKVYKDFWGAFERITSVATVKNKTFIKTALVGGQYALKNRPALYVQDRNKPLILVGNTRIEGTVYLPGKAVRSGNIGGTAYYGSRLIYGSIKESAAQMPVPAPEWLAHINTVTQQPGRFKADQLIALANNGSLVNTFQNPVKYSYSDGVIELSGVKISGNIIIYAEKKIVVFPSCQLTDVVLVAPEIEILDAVSGNFQALASKQLRVGKEVHLRYPSALVLREKEHTTAEDEEKPGITIGERTVVKGVVMFWGEEKEHNFSAQLTIKPGAAIYGELYCNQNLKLKGTVHGSVYTSNFIETRLGTVYQNHVFDGTISGDQLPAAYAGLPWKNSKKDVIKWLY